MAVIVQNKATDRWLESPHRFDSRDQVWPWGPSRDNAHHFASRGEAKTTIRGLYPEGEAPRTRDLSFHTV